MPMAVVAEAEHGRLYLPIDKPSMDSLLQSVQDYYIAEDIDSEVSHAECRGTFASNAQGGYYGFHEFKDYFTKRQLIALTTFSSLVQEAQQQAERDAVAAGRFNDHISLADGGTGARAYGEAIGVYLAFVVDKLSDYHSSICSWHSSKELIRNTFGRQAIPMVWDYAECNFFSSSAGCFDNMLEWVTKSLSLLPASTISVAKQFDAQTDNGLRNIAISTDPPYYDNIGYADLSDFFYVWMRQALKNTYPNIFRTMLVPKAEELIATPYRHEGSVEKQKPFSRMACTLPAVSSINTPVIQFP